MATRLRIIFQLLPSGCFEKSHWCFYDNVLTFSVDGGTLKYKLDNGGSTFNAYKCWWWNRK
jgi:hypothetical protein